jgi:hypothetical protein
MKLLISLSSYGDKNLDLLNKAIEKYKSYKKYDVSIDVHCTVDLNRNDINQIVHENPKTTSLFHRKDFIRELENYDLFLFAEYDMVIEESSIDTYLKYDKQLPIDYCLGFIRYENTPENTKYLIDLWKNISGYNYISNLDLEIQNTKYFTTTNVHQACYLLTKQKLLYIINNTEYNYSDLGTLGVESSSSSIFSSWPLGPRGIINKVLPINKNDLLNCLIHHSADCHCNPPGVNSTPEVFRSNTITINELLSDLKII